MVCVFFFCFFFGGGGRLGYLTLTLNPNPKLEGPAFIGVSSNLGPSKNIL